MKVRQAIDMANKMKPNAFPEEIVLRWLNECEGRIQTEIYKTDTNHVITYDIAADADKQLIVAFPYDRIYWMYLTAMIDFANGEYSNYQNSMQKVNEAIKEYHAWFMRNHHADETGGGSISIPSKPCVAISYDAQSKTLYIAKG